MVRTIFQSLRLLAALSLLTGVLYPLAVTALASAFFPWRAGGSLIERGGATVGSALVGQDFTARKYFWGRPSATAPMPYNAASSGGSNLGPTNPQLGEKAAARIAALKAADPEAGNDVPVDLVAASASGLDPQISPAAAEYQLRRVAKARGMTPEAVRAAVARHTQGRTLGLLGEPRVDVVQLNLELDAMQAVHP